MSSRYDSYDRCDWSWDYDYGPDPDDELADEFEYILNLLPESLLGASWEKRETAIENIREQLAIENELLLKEEARGGGQTHSHHRSRFRARNFHR